MEVFRPAQGASCNFVKENRVHIQRSEGHNRNKDSPFILNKTKHV